MFNVLLIILFSSILLYIINTIVIYIGTFRLNYPTTQNLPKVSVLVALRNEARTIVSCVKSLINLDYPEHLIEIILINDRSTDTTPEIIDNLKKLSPKIEIVHINHSIRNLSGKANAIAQGIEHASGEIILITDGDCVVPASWAKTHVSYYTKDVGIVSGFTLLDDKKDKANLFGKIQSLDWAYLLSIGSGAIGFGKPLSVIGNNFSFRKAAYDAVGGYQKMGFTIIEDFALMKSLLKHTHWQVRYPIDSKMLVHSKPMPTLFEFYHQRKRWAAGGKEVGLYGKFLMLISVLVHTLLPMFLIFSDPKLFLAGLLSVSVADLFLLSRTTALVKRRDLLKYFPAWEVFYFIYTLFYTPVLLFPTTVTWKNISYSWRFNWQLKKMFEQK